MEIPINDSHVRFRAQLTFLSLDFQPFDNIRGVRKFDAAVLPNDSLNVLIEFDIISVNINRSFRLSPLGTNVGLVALGSVGPGTLAPLRFVIVVLRWLGLRIINISHPQSDSTHPDDCIFLELETLGLISFFGVFAHDVPKLLLRIGVDGLQVDHVLVEYPIAFRYSFFSFALLIRYPYQLLGLLFLLVEVSSFTIGLSNYIGILRCERQDYLLLLLPLS